MLVRVKKNIKRSLRNKFVFYREMSDRLEDDPRESNLHAGHKKKITVENHEFLAPSSVKKSFRLQRVKSIKSKLFILMKNFIKIQANPSVPRLLKRRLINFRFVRVSYIRKKLAFSISLSL